MSLAKIHHLWYRFIEPPNSIQAPEDRRRARLFSALLLLFVPLTLIGALYTDRRDIAFIFLVIEVIVLGIAYGLSRTIHYQQAAILAVSSVSALPFTAFIIRADYSQASVNSLRWVFPAVVLGSLVLPLRSTSILVIANLGGLLLLPFLIRAVTFIAIGETLGIVAIISLLMLLAVAIRQQDLKQIQQQSGQLLENEARFRSLFEASFEGLVVSQAGILLDANQAFGAMFGYTLAEARGRPISTFIAPEHRQDITEKLASNLVDANETKGLRQDGTTFDLEVMSKAHIYKGQPVQVVAFRNITGYKQTENALAQMRDQALSASHFKSEILARVSHELRTPIGAVLGYAELLEDGVFGPLTDEQHQAAKRIIDGADYLAITVEELINQAQLETGKLRLDLAPFDVRSWLRWVEDQMRVVVEAKKLRFQVEVCPNIPEILIGDQLRLRQIVINLVGNAAKFTEMGEVKLYLQCPDVDHWAILVSDTGPGIPVEAQQLIFESFTQVDGSMTRPHGGSGLGLALVKQLTELMGGQVMLNSQLGQGSTFSVVLPCIKATATQSEA